SQNFAVDRAAAEQQLAVLPDVAATARANRAFLARVVRCSLQLGISQFLDLGSGIPTIGNVHEVAHAIEPAARVAYVDHEPVAVAHARRLLSNDSRVSVTQADLGDPAAVLAAPGVAGLLDFARPLAVLMVSVLHFLPEDRDPPAVVAAYRDACAAGSLLAVSHATDEHLSTDRTAEGMAIYRRTATPLTLRRSSAAHALMPGYAVLEPGVVSPADWRPDRQPTSADREAARASWAAAGILPRR
ncbi:SAM-dependent methyltransferase, partial [Saccharopolyspora sp. HNM0983]